MNKVANINSVELFDKFGKKFSKPINDPLHDFIECVKGNPEASLTNYMYDSKFCKKTKTTGADLWNKFIERGNYYIPQIEKKLIQQHAKTIAHLTPPNTHYIEFGPGTIDSLTKKTSVLIKENSHAQSYLAIDLYKNYVLDAQSYIGQNFQHLAVEGLVHNFYECEKLGTLYDNPVGLFFGNTIANTPEPKSAKPRNTIKNLKSIKQALGKSGYLIVTQDTNRDEKNLLASYDCEELAMNILYRIAEDPNVVGLDTSAFEYKAQWKPRFNYIDFSAVCKKDQTLILGAKMYQIKAGQEISLCRSYKYSADHFQSMGAEAGFEPIDVFLDETGRAALHVWKCSSIPNTSRGIV